MLVIIGADEGGNKDVLGLIDGFRGSNSVLQPGSWNIMSSRFLKVCSNITAQILLLNSCLSPRWRQASAPISCDCRNCSD